MSLSAHDENRSAVLTDGNGGTNMRMAVMTCKVEETRYIELSTHPSTQVQDVGGRSLSSSHVWLRLLGYSCKCF